ncbi:MAG: AbrB family transcriptional regulator, partial [Pseudomonadota bacterium]
GAKAILRMLALSGGYTLVLLAITLAFAFGMSWGMAQATDLDAIPVLLAYSPGGLAEMSLIALTLQIEVAFVATHHVVRVLLVMLLATPVFALIERFR